MVTKPVHLSYDGSFEGFLTCIFQIFDEKINVLGISYSEQLQPDMFSTIESVLTDNSKAKRVTSGLIKKGSSAVVRKVHYAFLSEQMGIEMKLLSYIKLIFFSKIPVDKDFSNPVILEIQQIVKMVHREKHRMEAFIRFKLTKDDIFFAVMEPDFNVLPIILDHFERRYADQNWIIYDLKRKIGLYYNLQKTNYISLEITKNNDLNTQNSAVYKDEEIEFEQLWQQYFKSTNIKSRVNMRLHIQHVPKRYWKYLTEKSSWQN